MQGAPRSEFHQSKRGKVKLSTHGRRVGERLRVLMPACEHVITITVSCGGVCTRLCACEQKVMTFNTARKCSRCGSTANAAISSTAGAATGSEATAAAVISSATTAAAGSAAGSAAHSTARSTVTSAGAAATAAAAAAAVAASDAAATSDTAATASAAAAIAASAASASDADSALEGPPSWWGVESDARFAECLYVAQMDGGYIQDRFYKQDTHLSKLFPRVGLEQWLDAKVWVQRSAKGGGIAAQRCALGKSRRLRFVNFSASRPSRCRTTQGAPDSSGAAWQTDDGARLCHDEEGRVYKVQPGPRAASSSVLALL